LAYPLNTTFYRLPDTYPIIGTVAGLLTAMHTSLTSSVDYRGTTIPSTHLWTWATGSTSGSISAIYNTAIPSGSDITQNPTILIAGFSGSATPSMISGDAYSANFMMLGLNKNGTTYINWTNALPMTTGSFTGFSRLTPVAANSTSTFIRNFISQNMLFTQIVQAGATQYWGFSGALIEPHTSYTSSPIGIPSSETDDRIYGVTTSNATLVSTTFLTNTSAAPFYGRMYSFVPATTSSVAVGKRITLTAGTANLELDINGNFIYDRIRIIRNAGGTYSASASYGNMTGAVSYTHLRAHETEL
jgi:hypothetical protein